MGLGLGCGENVYVEVRLVRPIGAYDALRRSNVHLVIIYIFIIIVCILIVIVIVVGLLGIDGTHHSIY